MNRYFLNTLQRYNSKRGKASKSYIVMLVELLEGVRWIEGNALLAWKRASLGMKETPFWRRKRRLFPTPSAPPPFFPAYSRRKESLSAVLHDRADLDERNLSNKYHDFVLFRLNRYLLVGIYYLEAPITSVLSVFFTTFAYCVRSVRRRANKYYFWCT